MNATGKYIIVEENGIEWAIVFPGSVSHRTAVSPQAKKVAAGFFSTEGDDIAVGGFSDTLNLRSRAGDEKIIKQSLFIAGIKNFLPVAVGG